MPLITPDDVREKVKQYTQVLNVLVGFWEAREICITKARERIKAKTNEKNDARFVAGVKWALMAFNEEILK